MTSHIGHAKICADAGVRSGDAGSDIESAAETIAQAAAKLVKPGSAVGISAGSTSIALARRITQIRDLTVVTNSPSVADILHFSAGPRRTVLLVGGVRTLSGALVGPIATRTIGGLHVDSVFVSADGVDTIAGFTSADMQEAEANRALVASARRLVVLAEYKAWGSVGRAGFASLADAAVLVMDRKLDVRARRVLRGAVGSLVLNGSFLPIRPLSK